MTEKYTLKFWHVRFGWHGTYVMHTSPDNILGITPEIGWWRPTRPWVERVVRRDIEKWKRRMNPEVIEFDA